MLLMMIIALGEYILHNIIFINIYKYEVFTKINCILVSQSVSSQSASQLLLATYTYTHEQHRKKMVLVILVDEGTLERKFCVYVDLLQLRVGLQILNSFYSLQLCLG